jgi:hypothetical protein
MWSTGIGLLGLTAAHPVDGRHRITHSLVFRIPWSGRTHSIAVNSSLAVSRAGNAIRRLDAGTDFILNGFDGIGRSLLLLRPLDVGVRVRQVGRSGWVTTSDRALLEVALQNITPRERILAKNTHVRAITGVC